MSARIEAGALSTLAPGTVRVVALPSGAFGAPPVITVEALVLLDQAGVPRAYLNRCRHLPIPLSFSRRASGALHVVSSDFLTPDGRALECRTHGALYRLDDGMCFEGPCQGRALLPIELSIELDALYLIATF